MAPLCSRTALVGPVPKGRWRLSWNVLVKESAPYTMCCDDNVHCDVWHWWSITAPRFTTKADGKCSLLLHVPAAPASSSAQEETTDTWWYRSLSFFMTMQGVTPLFAVTDLLRRCQWETLEHPPYSPDMSLCDYEHFAKAKESIRWSRYNTRCYRVIFTEHNKDGHADCVPVRCLPNTWQKVRGDYIEDT